MHEVREEYSVLRTIRLTTIRFSAVLLANLPFFCCLALALRCKISLRSMYVWSTMRSPGTQWGS